MGVGGIFGVQHIMTIGQVVVQATEYCVLFKKKIYHEKQNLELDFGKISN